MNMKRTLLAIGLTVVFLIAGANPAISAATPYPKGLKILNYYGNSFEPAAEGFKANWTAAGNTYVNVTNYDFSKLGSDGYNILLLPRTMGLSATDISNIQTWFATGDKLLWVGGDSDYAGLYVAQDTANPLLTKIGTQLRMSAISVEDPASNDEAAYRVVANETGVSSTLTDYVTQGFNRMVFHGPAAVNYMANGVAHDLRNASLTGDLANVNIVINSSSHAIASDADLTLGQNDFYAQSNTTGHYPMLVTDMASNSMVVVSAESVFTDYKNMYGHNDENGGDAHQGGMVVDRLISYYFNEIVKWTPPSDSTSGNSLPFNAFFAFFGVTAVAIVAFRRRQ